ncbi:hypothetical protein P22_0149 [Propionispora sp. 2/2-37]|uniref:prepilin-type N-terminal cleavage/methylation domain-containing protein n=1 Tax=Propionispora sp. 2/2-37 TaxID=1677858 RepID=UPI0006C1AEFB|nr:prepilin-type N-terminal cleavage/methylation domain-containing protein [Propionispora sp. 2/2-37]CUH94087.1 hypothetical protein P22_0149 [Propionispora sp. 2/2-37]
MQEQRGFTVMEVLITLLILSVLAGLAIPNLFKHVADRQLEDAARLLASDIRYLQQLSVNSPPGKYYHMFFRNGSPYGYYITSSTIAVKSVRFDNSVELRVPPGYVAFSASGAPQSGYSITLRSNKTKKLKYVLVEGAIGRVRISDKTD